LIHDGEMGGGPKSITARLAVDIKPPLVLPSLTITVPQLPLTFTMTFLMCAVWCDLQRIFSQRRCYLEWYTNFDTAV